MYLCIHTDIYVVLHQYLISRFNPCAVLCKFCYTISSVQAIQTCYCCYVLLVVIFRGHTGELKWFGHSSILCFDSCACCLHDMYNEATGGWFASLSLQQKNMCSEHARICNTHCNSRQKQSLYDDQESREQKKTTKIKHDYASEPEGKNGSAPASIYCDCQTSSLHDLWSS